MIERDLRVVWHPCTQMKEHPDAMPLLAVMRGEGALLHTKDHGSVVDAVSSWWTNLFGHAHPVIAEAIAKQAHTLPHVMFAGCTHQPGIRLAEALVDKTPNTLTRVFYTDNGSSAIEAALKMSMHSHKNRGQQRHRFIALQHGYHGETIGALSVTDVPLYRKTYEPLLLEPIFVRSPAPDLAVNESRDEACALAIKGLEDTLAKHGQHITAMVLEPMLQCAGGMLMYDAAYLSAARRLCDTHGVHLIADEIASGFYRTGTLFASEHADMAPDIMCLSKGLTAGSLPLAAVLASDAIYDSFLDDRRDRAFLHSHSYSGNPTACAAAVACLQLLDQPDTQRMIHDLSKKLSQASETFQSHPNVREVRQIGCVVAIELTAKPNTATPWPSHEKRGLNGYKAALKHGALLRPLGETFYWMPPYVLSDEQLDTMVMAQKAAIDAVVTGAPHA